VTERDPATGDGKWVVMGVVKGAHGVKGLARIASYTADPADLFRYSALVLGPGRTPVTLEHRGASKGGFLARLSTLATREDVDAARGFEIAIARDQLDDIGGDDEFYLTDLVGLAVQDPGGTMIGRVKSVENFGAEDLLEIALTAPVKGLGRVALVPFRRTLVTDIDLEAGTATIDMARWQADQTGMVAESQMQASGGDQ